MNIVHTKKELRAAIKRGDAEIVVGTVGLAILTPAIAAAPFTFGASLFAVAAATGVELAIIIAAIAVGLHRSNRQALSLFATGPPCPASCNQLLYPSR